MADEGLPAHPNHTVLRVTRSTVEAGFALFLKLSLLKNFP